MSMVAVYSNNRTAAIQSPLYAVSGPIAGYGPRLETCGGIRARAAGEIAFGGTLHRAERLRPGSADRDTHLLRRFAMTRD